ncbi:hypothetical protein L1887_40134 [Cichorium endivia]|nr:hypothetical protein L1887_40134 [Cichorium endivia]
MQKQKLGMEDEQNEYERIKGNGNTPVKGDRTDCRIGRKRFFGIERSRKASRLRLMVRRYYSIRFDQRNPEDSIKEIRKVLDECLSEIDFDHINPLPPIVLHA